MDNILVCELKEYQDTYALAMAKYGLQRGIDGSEARHTTTQEYYRELFTQKDVIAEKVEYLKQEQEDVRELTWDLYGICTTEKTKRGINFLRWTAIWSVKKRDFGSGNATKRGQK